MTKVEMEVEITAPEYTYRTVAREIAELDPNECDYERKILIKIKRLLHVEKYDLLSRIALYGRDDPAFGMTIVEEKMAVHEGWMAKPDKLILGEG